MNHILLLALAATAPGTQKLLDTTEAVGFAAVPPGVSRTCFADLDGDGFPDVVIDRHLVFLSRSDPDSPIGRRFVPVPPEESGLLEPERSTLTVFADISGDGVLDAIVAENVDLRKRDWKDHGRRTRWQEGRGDGTFEKPVPIAGVEPATTCAIAVGDVDLDGSLDLWLGNWYVSYGAGVAAYPNQLVADPTGRSPEIRDLPESSDLDLEPETDLEGRPTYGAMIAHVASGLHPELIELNYGRRWNRLWHFAGGRNGGWEDLAPTAGFDGDAIRHGRYPDWAIERMAARTPPIELEPEAPFRSNGNTFDCAVGDVDNDGDFDLFVAEITHGWAGESSDRSRLCNNHLQLDGTPLFESDEEQPFDRIPDGALNWNQGDLFCGLADLDHDTRLDVILSSGDYPDGQYLRIFAQVEAGTFEDRTEAFGLEHDGSQQISLADVEGDGDLDILVGQTFNRFTKEQKEGRSPRVRLFANGLTEGRGSITLRLEGDGKKVNRSAIGAVARLRLDDETMLSRQVVGPGGHAGKQSDLALHFGLGEHLMAEELEIVWPDRKGKKQIFTDVAAGRYRLRVGGKLERMSGD